MSQIDQIQVAASRLLNTILGGVHSEMLSSRAYRNKDKWPWVYRGLNAMFPWQDDHCKQSYEWETRQATALLKEITNP